MIETLKKLWKFSGDEKKNISKSMMVVFLYSLFAMGDVMAIYLVLSNVLEENKDMKIAWYALGLLVVSILGKATTKYFSQLQQTHAGYYMTANKRIHIADKLKHIPMGYFNENSLGEITGVATTGLEILELQASMLLVSIIGGTINAFVFTLFILTFDWRIGCVVAVGNILYLMVSAAMQKKSATVAPNRHKSQAVMVSAVLEYIQGMSIVKSFNLTGKGDKTVRDALENNCESNLKVEKVFTPYGMLQGITLQVFSVLMVLLSVSFFINGTMEVLDALMMVIVSFLVFEQIKIAGSNISLLRIVSSSMDATNKIDDIPEIDEKGKDMQPQNYNIQFENVDFSYENKKILNNVNFRIKEKTTTAIVGPSGSGKTTLCNLIARFWDVDTGRITIGDKNIKEYSLESLMDQMSMVFQEVYLFADTIENNIKFGRPEASHEEVVKVAKKACCHDFIMSLPNGYETVIGEGGDSLSGGEKQRISIARALLKDAPIILLDEVTANVDPENEDKLQMAIDALTKEKTIIMIAHRLKTVRNANQILVVDNGMIVQKGTHHELMKEKGIYNRFVEKRKEALGWRI